jgi:hypothetical protein
MARILVLSALALLLLSASDCHPAAKGKYKGKLEIAGICMHYTIRVLEGDMDTTRLENNWTDNTTGITYSRVFALDDPCSFPRDLKTGDEFYFNIDTSTAPRTCMQCEAFYPVPSKSLRIIVTGK